MVITGKYFGDERNGGEVVIGGYAPVSSGYLDWSDSRISLRIPEDVSSGMVRVITKNGKSRGLLFTFRSGQAGSALYQYIGAGNRFGGNAAYRQWNGLRSAAGQL